MMRRTWIQCLASAVLMQTSGIWAAAIESHQAGDHPADARTALSDADLMNARAIMAHVARAYREAPGLIDSMTQRREVMGAASISRMTVELGGGTDARLHLRGHRFTAISDVVYATRDGVPDKYFAVPLTRHMDYTLATTPGGFGRATIPHFLFRYVAADDDPITAFSVNLPLVLSIARLSSVVIDGRRLHQIDFSAKAGSVTAQIDSESFLIRFMTIKTWPPGSPTSGVTKIELTFNPRVLPSPPSLTVPTEGRKRVERIDHLARMEGESVADCVLTSPEGATVPLDDLKGSVVILYFWSTRCVPCLKGLRQLDEFVTWMHAGGRPVRLYGVLAGEDGDAKARQAAASGVWREESHRFPTLVDPEDLLALGMGLAAERRIVILSRDMTVFKVLDEPPRDLNKLLVVEVEAALGIKRRPPAPEQPGDPDS